MGKRPNVVFIISDDHRHDAIHALGDIRVRTPVLDQLAQTGTALTNMHIMGGMSGAVCVPSRACVHTGVNVFRAIPETTGPHAVTIHPELTVMPQLFREHGYHTYATGKWHNDKGSFNRSFCGGSELFFGGMNGHRNIPVYDYDPTGAYPKEAARCSGDFSTELFADAAIRFLEGYEEEAPFFLYAAFTAPHDPRTPPESYAEMYPAETIPLPGNFMPEHPFDNGELRIRDEELAPFPRTAEAIRQHVADYYGMISHLDHHIGRILQTLQQTGRAEDTIIVYTADHGLSVGQHGLLGKQNLYDHSVRIPFIVSGPGITPGRKVNALTWQIDIYPTLCELAGLSPPGTVEGISAYPAIKGESGAGRSCVYSVYKDIQRMIKDGDWKLIRYYRSAHTGLGSDRIQLFHLRDDPWELHDVSGQSEQAGRISRMAEALAAWQQAVGDPLKDISVIP